MKPAPAPSILLVDRSPGTLMFQETILRRQDKSVWSVNSGGQALLKIRADKPRLVIFGFELADMTAPELCRDVRSTKEIQSTSLLFVADSGKQKDADLCMAAGCNDVIYRPLHALELDAKIARLIAIPVRKDFRTLTRLKVEFEPRKGAVVLGHSLNLSASGMLIEAETVLPPEAVVQLHFHLNVDNKPLEIESRIVRAEFSGGSPRYGVAFTNLADPERERIAVFISRLKR